MPTCPQCATTYPRHIRICPVDGTVLDDEQREDPLVGHTLDGKYRIDTRLGEGGMGTVYRATHLMLGKAIALKLIKPELVTSKEIVRRFQREARAASALSHPGIATVHDLGQTDDGTLYIAMEFVEGPTLKDVLASGPLAPDRIVRLLRQVTEALAVAHDRQIIHRDLKPQNIVLRTRPGGRETATLLDFGVARMFDDDATRLTSTGIAVGTPQYMSPEQASGSIVDPRSDLYSLGVILYEMLTGEVPFGASNALALLIKHVHEAPMAPSRRRPDLAIPPSLEAVALRCLEKTPDRRYQTADELVAALDAADEASRQTAPILPPTPAPQPPVETPRTTASTAEDSTARLESPSTPLAPGVDDAQHAVIARPPSPVEQDLRSAGNASAAATAAIVEPSAPPGAGAPDPDVAPPRKVARGAVVLFAIVAMLTGAIGYRSDWFWSTPPASPRTASTAMPSAPLVTPEYGTKNYTFVSASGRWTIPVRQTDRGELVALDRIGPIFGLTVVDDSNGDLTIRAGGTKIQLVVSQALAAVSGRLVPLSTPVERDGATWLVPLDLLPRAVGPAIGQRIDVRRDSALIVVGDVPR